MTGTPNTTIFRALNGHPAENLAKVIELMGGIEKLVGDNDVAVIKPNVQWWNQGAPNLAALKAFTDLIMNRPGGFHGEVVFAENCHRGPVPWESMESGWRRDFARNSGLERVSNFNDLGRLLKEQYGDRFSVCHLIDVDAGSRRVQGPEDGPGYVYCDGMDGVPLLALDNGAAGEAYRAVIMTYPIFKTDRGTLVDFHHGIWANGRYTGQPLKFINFSAINHHSIYCGATSSIKNYMGISDLSGGPDPQSGGKLTETYYNFHSFPFNKWAKGPVPGMLGAAIGMFLDTVRKADLNITTAEWVGLVSRTELPVAHTRAVLAGTDPVALDFHAAKYLLYPNSKIPLHNPEHPNGPLHQVLAECAERCGGLLDEKQVSVCSYDNRAKALQTNESLAVIGEKKWGANPKILAKYMLLRGWGKQFMRSA
jgi:hypothetical protein